jgi:hypothetical protein
MKELERLMTSFCDKALLHKLRLCRADLVGAIGASEIAPLPKTLRELADLQLVIMATEQAIRDKQDAGFVHSLGSLNAA